MNLKLFTDLIDALSKVVAGLRSIVNMSNAERQKYRLTIGETFLLLDSTLSMVILRLGDILFEQRDNEEFLSEVRKLGNYREWVEVERSFRFCGSLRTVYEETRTLRGQLAGRLAVGDWDTLLHRMDSVFSVEQDVAGYISNQLYDIAVSATSASGDQTIQTIRTQVDAFRKAVDGERLP